MSQRRTFKTLSLDLSGISNFTNPDPVFPALVMAAGVPSNTDGIKKPAFSRAAQAYQGHSDTDSDTDSDRDSAEVFFSMDLGPVSAVLRGFKAPDGLEPSLAVPCLSGGAGAGALGFPDSPGVIQCPRAKGLLEAGNIATPMTSVIFTDSALKPEISPVVTEVNLLSEAHGAGAPVHADADGGTGASLSQ